MRRALVPVLVFALGSLLAAALVSSPPAAAQTPEGVSVTLLDQPAWNSPRRPLTLTLRVTNASPTPLAAVAISLAIGFPTTSRIAYEQSLVPTNPITYAFGRTFSERGTIPPGRSRTFRISQSLAAVSAIGADGLYPVQVSLVSKDQTVATIRTPMVFLADRQRVPLNLAWAWVFDDPLQVAPGGTFLPGPIEGDVAPGGRLAAMAAALLAAPGPADVVVSPVLLDELGRMARGYRIERAGTTVRVRSGTGPSRDAAALLSTLRAIVRRPGVELSALPYGDADLRALIASGLGKESKTLAELGRSVVKDDLGVEPSAAVARPLGSSIDGPTAAKLARLGASVLLLNPGTVSAPAGPTGRPLPVARLALPGGGGIAAVAPDPNVASIAGGYAPEQSVLAAHATLGELAAEYFEFPGTAGRGAAIVFPEQPSYPPAFFGAFASLVGASPWLRTTSASALAAIAEPKVAESIPRQPPALQFPPAFVHRLLSARAALAQFAQAVAVPERMTVALGQDLYLAEGSAALTSPDLGVSYIGAVTSAIQRVYRGVQAPVDGKLVTLTSLRGVIPIPVRNASPYPVRLRIVLQANRRLTFVRGNVHDLVLPPGDRTVTFSVRAETTGRFPLEVLLQTRSSTPTTIASAQMIVRSTAYNRVALVFTIGAALFLLAWWGRRFLPRRTA